MKKIKFIPTMESMDYIDIDPPKPAILEIPKWYKQTGLYINPELKLHKNEKNNSNLTIKSCVPVFDAITSGYILTTPCDIDFVDPKVFGFRVTWDSTFTAITEHGHDQTKLVPLPDKYEPIAFKFESFWRIVPPKGYSLLFTHPFYRFDLPFITTTGIVDSDKFTKAINLPFFIEKNFIGKIEKGTPIAQIIPIKRERWESQREKYDPKYKFFHDNLFLKSFKSYKKRWWEKKIYE